MIGQMVHKWFQNRNFICQVIEHRKRPHYLWIILYSGISISKGQRYPDAVFIDKMCIRRIHFI